MLLQTDRFQSNSNQWKTKMQKHFHAFFMFGIVGMILIAMFAMLVFEYQTFVFGNIDDNMSDNPTKIKNNVAQKSPIIISLNTNVSQQQQLQVTFEMSLDVMNPVWFNKTIEIGTLMAKENEQLIIEFKKSNDMFTHGRITLYPTNHSLCSEKSQTSQQQTRIVEFKDNKKYCIYKAWIELPLKKEGQKEQLSITAMTDMTQGDSLEIPMIEQQVQSNMNGTLYYKLQLPNHKWITIDCSINTDRKTKTCNFPELSGLILKNVTMNAMQLYLGLQLSTFDISFNL